MVTGWKLSKNYEPPSVDQTLHRSMIGSLLYLATSRPDIVQAVCMVARYQANPKKSNVNAVRRIFGYLQGTLEYGLCYPKKGDLTLHSYTNGDWAGCMDDRKSTSGGSLFLGNKLVSWNSRKKESISLSTAKAKYIEATTSCSQVLWMKQTSGDIQVNFLDPIPIMCDISSTINISNKSSHAFQDKAHCNQVLFYQGKGCRGKSKS